jgi:hypothetical protein
MIDEFTIAEKNIGFTIKNNNNNNNMPASPMYNQDQISEFLRNDVTGDLRDVPGLGPSAIKALSSGKACDRVTNTFELIGKYLMLNADADKFCAFLKTRGVPQRRVVTDAIAQKCGLLLPQAGAA